MLTVEQVNQLKNGQHIRVRNFKGRYIDALFIKYDQEYGVYAHHMGESQYSVIKSIYGTQDYYKLRDIKIVKGKRK